MSLTKQVYSFTNGLQCENYPSIPDSPESLSDGYDANVSDEHKSKLKLLQMKFTYLKEPRKRTRTTSDQLEILLQAFEKDPIPTPKQRKILAAKTGMTPRSVQVWFQNRRAKYRTNTSSPSSSSSPSPSSSSGAKGSASFSAASRARSSSPIPGDFSSSPACSSAKSGASSFPVVCKLEIPDVIDYNKFASDMIQAPSQPSVLPAMLPLPVAYNLNGSSSNNLLSFDASDSCYHPCEISSESSYLNDEYSAPFSSDLKSEPYSDDSIDSSESFDLSPTYSNDDDQEHMNPMSPSWVSFDVHNF